MQTLAEAKKQVEEQNAEKFKAPVVLGLFKAHNEKTQSLYNVMFIYNYNYVSLMLS